ncbi:RNA exonuclease 4 isoform X3 [Loxodonta africana]|uniref:RNA exonuclease 4 isoform X3 n=1 Tax=Loxodonta africana TaxID=9785 RepID=UPI0030CB2731
MVKAKVPAPRRARSSPAAKPGPVGRLRRRKNRRGQLGKSKAREVNKKQGSGPRLVLRPPKAPEDFSQNWKALQEDPRGPGRRRHLPQRPPDQSLMRRKLRKGHRMAPFLQHEGTPSRRGRKPRWQLQPCPRREELAVVQEEVAEMLKGRILVGHALHNDLKVLFLDHPKKKVRDTQKYKPFKSQVKSGRPSLKLLSQKILGIRVQEQEHCSIQDAQAAMRLYIMVKKEWESAARDKLTTAAAPDSHRT